MAAHTLGAKALAKYKFTPAGNEEVDLPEKRVIEVFRSYEFILDPHTKEEIQKLRATLDTLGFVPF